MSRIPAWAAISALAAALALAPLQAQAPVVGDIEFYGLHKLAPERILNALKLHPGDPLPASKSDMEDRIDEIPGVVLSIIEAVCCEGPRVTLFIGVEERGAPHADFRSDPAGQATLPAPLLAAYDGFVDAVRNAAAKGNSGEDLSAGHSLMDDPDAWAFQQRFLGLAPADLATLRDVLHHDTDASQRAAAAALIGYAPHKAAVIDDLQYALQDPDPAVRANALRSLTAIAVLASRQPALGLRIQPIWVVQLLNSVVLSDRVEAVKALLALTETPGSNAAAALDVTRERALPSVVEMARWKTPAYALPPFVLAGRLGGMSYVDTLQQWASGHREPVLSKALANAPRKKSGSALQ